MTTYAPGPVVVGVESAADGEVIERGAWEARLRHVQLWLVHGLVEPPVPAPTLGVGAQVGAQLDSAQEMLVAAAHDVATHHPDLTVKRAVVAQSPPSLLVDLSRTASLIVVGTHDLDAVSRMLAGSVSSPVAAHSHAPVMVVRHTNTVPPDAPVVIGVDGSASSNAALAFAADEADARGVPLVAVCAWDVPLIHGLQDASVKAHQEADTLLTDAVAGRTGNHPGLRVDRRAVRSADPADALCEAADRACLVVVGCRGRGALTGIMLGSVSHAVLRHAGTSVTVVHEG
jgi:nucleotide-binding universal stress UspA family protein